ncbi:MAG: hypothetical protein FWD61_14885, partial [Phycisphaerales bacterium]|nr:hypothetical protein [Phycisphaerales bacterium]
QAEIVLPHRLPCRCGHSELALIIDRFRKRKWGEQQDGNAGLRANLAKEHRNHLPRRGPRLAYDNFPQKIATPCVTRNANQSNDPALRGVGEDDFPAKVRFISQFRKMILQHYLAGMLACRS